MSLATGGKNIKNKNFLIITNAKANKKKKQYLLKRDQDLITENSTEKKEEDFLET
jgi:hypothetical protein